MIVTASRIPVPEPIAPMKSARTVNAPMHTLPNAPAVGNLGYICSVPYAGLTPSDLASPFVVPVEMTW